MTIFTWEPRTPLSAQTVAEAVWDAQISDHVQPGSFGALVQRLLTVAKFLGLK